MQAGQLWCRDHASRCRWSSRHPVGAAKFARESFAAKENPHGFTGAFCRWLGTSCKWLDAVDCGGGKRVARWAFRLPSRWVRSSDYRTQESRRGQKLVGSIFRLRTQGLLPHRPSRGMQAGSDAGGSKDAHEAASHRVVGRFETVGALQDHVRRVDGMEQRLERRWPALPQA